MVSSIKFSKSPHCGCDLSLSLSFFNGSNLNLGSCRFAFWLIAIIKIIFAWENVVKHSSLEKQFVDVRH